MPDVVQEARRLFHSLLLARGLAEDPDAVGRMFVEAADWTLEKMGDPEWLMQRLSSDWWLSFIERSS